jgi:drug/metabolite transporter (DMT)-like permease
VSKGKLYLLLILAAVFYGANFHFAKHVVTIIPLNTLASIRFTIATVLLLGAMVLFEKTDKALIKKNLWTLIWLGLVGVFGFNILFFIGMQTSSPVNGALINALNPLLTILLSRFALNTIITRNQVIGLVISFIGVIAVISGGSMATLTSLSFAKGDLFLFAATASFAVFNVYYRKKLPDFPAMTATFYTTASATILFILLSFTEPAVSWAEFSFVSWVCILGLALLGTFLAYIFWNIGLAGLGGDKASVFMNIVPFSTAVIAVALGEPITTVQLIGGALILSGVYLSSRVKKIEN